MSLPNQAIQTGSPYKSLRMEGTVTRRNILAIIPGLKDDGTPYSLQELGNIALLIKSIPGICHVEVVQGIQEETQTMSYWHRNPLRRFWHWLSTRW